MLRWLRKRLSGRRNRASNRLIRMESNRPCAPEHAAWASVHAPRSDRDEQSPEVAD